MTAFGKATRILSKGNLVESDEARYGDMNRRFHSLIVQASGSKVISEAIVHNDRIPFAAAHAIAFDRFDLLRTYDMLRYAHRQHHAIVQALENKEGARVAALMFEHAYGIRESINLSRAISRGEAEPGEHSPFEQDRESASRA